MKASLAGVEEGFIERAQSFEAVVKLKKLLGIDAADNYDLTDADLDKMNIWLDTNPDGNADQNPDILITEDDAYYA